ncbi:MAG: phage antirepressor protein [Nanoarchaeota archaeon]|nr:phage antirepressor protein [Nanoarchaeota archaeon]
MDEKKEVVISEGKKIRRVWYNQDWFYAIVDIVSVLTHSKNPKGYLKDMGRRDLFLNEGWGQIAIPLLIETSGGKQLINCAGKKGILRIIQSIPSKKDEPFKLWLAKVGSERIDEIIDPDLSIDRAIKTYSEKGYSNKWINQRIKTIEVRKELTDEWKRIGIKENDDFAILTNDITHAWSGKPIKEYKEFKNIEKGNLRDNVINLGLVLNMLAEATATEFSKNKSSENFQRSRNIAIRGGTVAGNARKEIEMELGKEIVSPKNSKKIINLEEENKREFVKIKKRK